MLSEAPALGPGRNMVGICSRAEIQEIAVINHAFGAPLETLV